jgi:hypothetical protein
MVILDAAGAFNGLYVEANDNALLQSPKRCAFMWAV